MNIYNLPTKHSRSAFCANNTYKLGRLEQKYIWLVPGKYKEKDLSILNKIVWFSFMAPSKYDSTFYLMVKQQHLKDVAVALCKQL